MTAVATHGRLTAAYLTVALVALLGGVVTGLAQGLEHAGIDVYPALAPVVQSYYHGMSLHGVLNVLVWTIFFICGFLPIVAVQAFDMPLAAPRLGWFAFWLMTGGVPHPHGVVFADAMSGADHYLILTTPFDNPGLRVW